MEMGPHLKGADAQTKVKETISHCGNFESNMTSRLGTAMTNDGQMSSIEVQVSVLEVLLPSYQHNLYLLQIQFTPTAVFTHVKN